MTLPIKPQELQNPKQTKNPNPYLNKATQDKKKSFANCACEIPFHQLAVLDIYFRGFYPYEKKCKVCCMCFFYTCHHEVKVVILHPFFLQRFCQQIMYHLVCPLSCSFCKKYRQILHTITVKSNC